MFRVGWPDAAVIRGTLGTIRDRVKASKITRTALIFVGRVFENDSFSESRLYHPGHQHILRPGQKAAAKKARTRAAAAGKESPVPE